MAKEFTITANVTFKVTAETKQDAANWAYQVIRDGAGADNIQVWDEDPAHWFADRYTYTDPPVYIEPNPQGVGSIGKPKAAKVEVQGIA